MKKKQNQVGFARELRQKQIDAEKALWIRLRNRQLGGVNFRRQQPTDSYIVDFASLERKLLIEIDGGQHNEETIKERGEDDWAKGKGLLDNKFLE